MGLLSRVKTWVEGDTLTAADLNAEFDNVINTGLAPAYIDDDSANEAGMQTVVDPYPDSAVSLATNLKGELERLRYLVKQITGETQWYIDPDTNLAALATFAGVTLGEANLKLFVNSGATAPEWAKGMVIKNFTRNMTAATGDVAYTGFGFKPSLVKMTANLTGTLQMSIGYWDGTTHFYLMDNWATINDTWSSNTDKLAWLYGAGPTAQSCVGKTLDSDGLTVTWTKLNSPGAGTANISIAAWR